MDRAIRDGRGVSTETRSIVRASIVAYRVRGRGAFVFRGSLFGGIVAFRPKFRPFSKNWIQLFVFHHILLTEPDTSGSRRFAPLTRNPLSRTRTFLHVRVPAGYHWTPRTSSAKVMRIFRQLSRPLRYVIRSSRPFPSRRIDPRVPSIRNPRRGFVGFAPPVTTWKGFARRRRSPSSPVVSR